MRRSTILVLNKFNFLNYIRKNRIILLLSIFFLLGIILGVVLISRSNVTDTVAKAYYERYILIHHNRTFLYVLLNSFLSSLIYIFILFLTGTSMVGIILSPFLVCVRGYLYGVFLAFLYHTQALKGIAFNAIMVIPSAIFFLVCLLLCARESLNFSFELAKLTFKRNFASINIFDFFKNYCGRYTVLLVLLIISALIDATFTQLFFKFFNL